MTTDLVTNYFWVQIFEFLLSLFSLTEDRLYKKKLLRSVFLMCRFWVIARQQPSEDGCFVRESLALTLQPLVKGSCWMLLFFPHVFASRKSNGVANTQTLVWVFQQCWDVEELEVLGAVCFSPSLCRCQSALGWQTHTCCGSGRLPRAPCSASGERAALGIPIIRTSVSVCCLVSGDRAASCGEIVGIKWDG